MNRVSLIELAPSDAGGWELNLLINCPPHGHDLSLLTPNAGNVWTRNHLDGLDAIVEACRDLMDQAAGEGYEVPSFDADGLRRKVSAALATTPEDPPPAESTSLEAAAPYSSLQALGHTHFVMETYVTHLSHLAVPLAWPHGPEALIEVVEAVRSLSREHQEGIALGGAGPYDLLVFPGWEAEPMFRIFANIDQGRHINGLEAAAAGLLPLVGNNGCGPDNAADLVATVRSRHRLARYLGRPVVVGGWCGLFEMLVKPDGRYLLLDQQAPTCKTLKQ